MEEAALTSEQTATRAREALDKDRWAVELTVRQVMHLLHEYIPRACEREATDKLFDAFFINGVELTTNTMRKEYEEWKRLELNTTMLSPMTKVQP